MSPSSMPPPNELIPGLFDLKTRKPIAIARDPISGMLRFVNESLMLNRVLIYDFGCEPHRRLLVRGPGPQLREFGVEPAHRGFWTAYARGIDSGSVGLTDGFAGPKFPMPWIDWSSASAPGPEKPGLPLAPTEGTESTEGAGGENRRAIDKDIVEPVAEQTKEQLAGMVITVEYVVSITIGPAREAPA